MNRRWICNDVWMDILPSFDHSQLGLKLALLSPRFNALVDKHFDGKSEWTIWRPIKIRKDTDAEVPKLFVFTDDANNFVPFPLLDRPLPNKIRFNCLQIKYIDHSVIAFLRSNQQIFDNGTDLQLWVPSSHTADDQPIWDIFVRELLPIFSTNIRRLGVIGDDQLDNLLHLTSQTILSDLNQLDSINSSWVLPDVIGDFDRPNLTAGEILSKWLHTPTKDGQPKRLRCSDDFASASRTIEWVNNFKKEFLCAATSVSYKIQFFVHATPTSMVPFELANDQTQEKLTLTKATENEEGISLWIMKRCPIGETAAVHWEDEYLADCNNVDFWLFDCCIGPLSPPPAEEEEAGQSSEKGASSDNDE